MNGLQLIEKVTLAIRQVYQGIDVLSIDNLQTPRIFSTIVLFEEVGDDHRVISGIRDIAVLVEGSQFAPLAIHGGRIDRVVSISGDPPDCLSLELV